MFIKVNSESLPILGKEHLLITGSVFTGVSNIATQILLESITNGHRKIHVYSLSNDLNIWVKPYVEKSYDMNDISPWEFMMVIQEELDRRIAERKPGDYFESTTFVIDHLEKMTNKDGVSRYVQLLCEMLDILKKYNIFVMVTMRLEPTRVVLNENLTKYFGIKCITSSMKDEDYIALFGDMVDTKGLNDKCYIWALTPEHDVPVYIPRNHLTFTEVTEFKVP